MDRPVARKKSAFIDLQIGTDGSFWVKEFPWSNQSEQVNWIRFDVVGRFSCHLELNSEFDVYEFASAYVLGKSFGSELESSRSPQGEETGKGHKMIRTIEQAYQFVKQVKICTIFRSHGSEYASLWENIDLPEKQPGEKGWGKKVSAVWTWKNQLPSDYPNDIFYGKIQGGAAVLMDLDYLAQDYFPRAYEDVQSQNKLAQHIHGMIAVEPWDTTALRKATMHEVGCTKSQFDTALKNLQITMNIVRLNDPQIERDTWVPFKEVYLDIWRQHVTER